MKQTGLICLILIVYQLSMAQKYEPTTSWPFLYKDFKEGVVYFSDQGKTKTQLLNIHLQNSTLYHQEGDDLLLSNPKGIIKIVIGADDFIFVNGELMQLIRGNTESALVKSVKGDYKALIKPATGAYGLTNEVSSNQELSSITNMNYTQAQLNKEEGRRLPLIEKYFLVINEKVIPATKKEIEKSLTTDGKKKLQSFVKENKIKYDEQGLIRILDYLQTPGTGL